MFLLLFVLYNCVNLLSTAASKSTCYSVSLSLLHTVSFQRKARLSRRPPDEENIMEAWSRRTSLKRPPTVLLCPREPQKPSEEQEKASRKQRKESRCLEKAIEEVRRDVRPKFKPPKRRNRPIIGRRWENSKRSARWAGAGRRGSRQRLRKAVEFLRLLLLNCPMSTCPLPVLSWLGALVSWTSGWERTGDISL